MQEEINSNNFGTFERPLDISELNVPLSSLKLLTMLLDDDLHCDVNSLTEDEVGELDLLVQKLQLSIYNSLYFARTRLDDQTGSSMRC